MKRIYLDNAAGTPIDELVFDKMLPYLKDKFGNPSAIYHEGMVAHSAVDSARTQVANMLGCHSDEIIFVGSGSESDNLAIKGVLAGYNRENDGVPHMITSVIEHPAVLTTIKKLEKKELITATYIPVDGDGLVDPKDVKEAITDKTILVSIMYANSEIGTVQPILEISKVIRKIRGNIVTYPYFHTDACQAVNYLDMDVETLGVDLVTLNGSKNYGPKGVGALYKKRGVKLQQIIDGGGQEEGLRAGTENVAGIVGMGEAIEITEGLRISESERLTQLRDYFIEELKKAIPDIILNGSAVKRLPNNINITIPDMENDLAVIGLDAYGISTSSKSACKSSDSESSYVVKALGDKDAQIGSTLRITMGRDTTKESVDFTVSSLLKIVEKSRKLRSL